MSKKNLYTVNVGNIGNIDCVNHTEAKQTFTEYVKQSKAGYGRAGNEPVALLRNGDPLKEFDPQVLKFRKGSLKAKVLELLNPPNEEVRYTVVAHGFIRDKLGWEHNDSWFMLTGASVRETLDAVEGRWHVFKATYRPGTAYKYLEDRNAGEEGQDVCLEIDGMPFVCIKDYA
jgi:hypothetical protein